MAKRNENIAAQVNQKCIRQVASPLHLLTDIPFRVLHRQKCCRYRSEIFPRKNGKKYCNFRRRAKVSHCLESWTAPTAFTLAMSRMASARNFIGAAIFDKKSHTHTHTHTHPNTRSRLRQIVDPSKWENQWAINRTSHKAKLNQIKVKSIKMKSTIRVEP